MSAVKENDKTLFLAILLLKYCFLRPNEMRKLRKSDFDLDKGCIHRTFIMKFKFEARLSEEAEFKLHLDIFLLRIYLWKWKGPEQSQLFSVMIMV